MHGHHVGVLKLTSNPRLVDEIAPPAFVVREVGGQLLEGHLSLDGSIQRHVYDPHATFTETPNNLKAPILQSNSGLERRLCRGGAWPGDARDIPQELVEGIRLAVIYLSRIGFIRAWYHAATSMTERRYTLEPPFATTVPRECLWLRWSDPTGLGTEGPDAAAPVRVSEDGADIRDTEVELLIVLNLKHDGFDLFAIDPAAA